MLCRKVSNNTHGDKIIVYGETRQHGNDQERKEVLHSDLLLMVCTK
jgi:hypothetical protein